MSSYPLQIGITGGIGAGKTIVCNIFNSMGVPIYNADIRAKWLMQNNVELQQEISSLFGTESYSNDGALNRAFIASRVFNNRGALDKLNELVHPKTAEDYSNWVKNNSNNSYLIKEAALLFETGSYKILDKILLVTAPKQMRIARVLKRDPQRSEKEVQGIIDNQWSESEKIKLADYQIINDDSKLLIPQVLKLDKLFRESPNFSRRNV